MTELEKRKWYKKFRISLVLYAISYLLMVFSPISILALIFGIFNLYFFFKFLSVLIQTEMFTNFGGDSITLGLNLILKDLRIKK